MIGATDIFGRAHAPAKPTGAVVRLVLPWPPSANRYWRHAAINGRAVTYLTAEGKAYKSAAYVVCARAGVRPISGPIRITFRLYRPARRGDADNYTPLVQDAISGRAYHDDSQIVESHTYRNDDKINPRVEVEIAPLSDRLFEVG